MRLESAAYCLARRYVTIATMEGLRLVGPSLLPGSISMGPRRLFVAGVGRLNNAMTQRTPRARYGLPTVPFIVIGFYLALFGSYVALSRELASACSEVTTMLQSKIDAPDRALARPEVDRFREKIDASDRKMEHKRCESRHSASPDEQTDRMVTKVHEMLYGIIGAMVDAAIDAKLDAVIDAKIDAKLQKWNAERQDRVGDENRNKK
jgi:hypothetical protein